MGWRDLGIDEDDIPASTRASMDGQVPAALNYESWLRTQDSAFQRKVLGKTRFELWSSGKLKLSQMANSEKVIDVVTLKRLAGVEED